MYIRGSAGVQHSWVLAGLQPRSWGNVFFSHLSLALHNFLALDWHRFRKTTIVRG